MVVTHVRKKTLDDFIDRSISGDPTREAVESLRGYAYQLYASAVAWMTLPQNGRLYLEVAEDYATLVRQTLNAVQVKATGGSITLNTPSVRETINSLFDLKAKNPGKVVTIEYLTTSVIGREAAKEHWVQGVGGLDYWQLAANGADVEPLRKRLLESSLSATALDFLASAGAEEVRADLIARINWRCGEPPLDDLRERMQEYAVYRCEHKGEPIRFADPFADKALVRVLETVLRKPPKPLTAAHLITLFDDVARTSVPTSVLEQMLGKGIDATNRGGSAVVVSQPVLDELGPSPFTLSPREELVENISQILSSSGVAWLHAGSGYGKTTLAAIVADRQTGAWKIVRCVGLDAKATVSKLRRSIFEITDVKCDGLVLDDIDHLADKNVQIGLSSLFRAAKNQSCLVVATSHHVPSPMRLRELALTPEDVLPVSDFSEAEVVALVEAEGGDPRLFGRYVYMGAAAGHPQLTHALVLGLKSRSWPKDDIQNLAAIIGADSDLGAVREEVRRRLLSELPPSDLQLLGRLTLIVGPFPRSLATALGEKPPEIDLPGASFDRLLGPWIDTVSKERFRPSSLVSGLGMDILGPQAVIRLNGEIARLRIPGKTINSEEADGIFLNAIIGKAVDILDVIFTATFGAPVRDFPRLAQVLQTLCLLRTDQPLFADNPRISAQMRALQVLLVAASERTTKLQEAIKAFDKELLEVEEEYARTLNYGVIGKLSILPGVFDILPGYVDRVAALRRDPVVRRKVEENFSEADGMPKESDEILRSMFAYQIMSIKRMSTLTRFLDEVAALPHDDRDFFVRPFAHSPGDKALAVRGPWRAITRDAGASRLLASEYLALAEKALDLGDNEVGIAAYETAAVITDEDLSDPVGALKILETAASRTENSWSLDRHRCRIFFNTQRYHQQLAVSERLLLNNATESIEMVYLLRETAIAYAHTGNHGASADCFRRAAVIAAQSKLPDVRLTALGLIADEAVQAFEDGQRPRALKALVEVVPQVEQLEGEGLREIALKTLVPHTIAAISDRCNTVGRNPGVEYSLFAGLNSNPNPSPDIKGLKREATYLIWIVLYHLERVFGHDCGVGLLLRSSEWDSRIMTSTDRYLIQDRFQRSFGDGDAPEFCESVIAEAAARNWTPSANLMLSFQSAPIGRIPTLSVSALETHRSFIGGAALLFIVYHTLAGRWVVAERFIEQQTSTSFPLLTADDLASLRDGLKPDDSLESAAVGTLLKVFRAGGKLSAEDAFIIGIRLVGMRHCDPTGKAFDKLYDWLIVEWGYIVREQRFRLRNPDTASATIERQKDMATSGIAGLVQLCRAIRPYIAIILSPEITRDLMGA